MAENLRLKTVGYWKDYDCRKCPQPQWLVRTGWHSQDLDRIVAYLRAGQRCFTYFGFSQCRFRNCPDKVCRKQNGSKDVTDGVWIWPEGLAHYVECHSVILPEEFVATMIQKDWVVPRHLPEASEHNETIELDEEFWIGWARENQVRPWYDFW